MEMAAKNDAAIVTAMPELCRPDGLITKFR